MGQITVPHFPRDTKQKQKINFFLRTSDRNHLLNRGGEGLLTKNTSLTGVGKRSDQKHLLNRGGGMVIIEWNGPCFTNESLLN